MQVILQDKNKYVLRLDPGEEIVGSLKAFVQANKVTAAWFNGLGAANQLELYYYNIKAKTYENKLFGSEDFEILSLTGNIGRAEGEVVIHCHGVFSDQAMQVYGGHVNQAVVSVTCEIFLTTLTGEINRQLHSKFNLKLMK